MTMQINDSEILSSPSEDDDVIISVNNVSKKFCRNLKQSYLYGLKDIGAELVGKPRYSSKLRKGEFWALDNVSIEVKRGESIGLIGVNGSGKTTLLKIISGLIKPDNGYVKVKGRLAALIALGAGFNPVLSGRENVYINMSIFGLTRKEIDLRFQEVLDFAEIWDAIDAPVRTYSSGMKARLGFASAIYTNPDILLIDEVLAVGDFKFRTKCYRKLSELRKSGVSFVLVSHSAGAITSNCDSAAYLAKGKLVMNGNANLVVQKYEEDLCINQISNAKVLTPGEVLFSSNSVSSTLKIKALSFQNSKGKVLDTLVSGKPAYLNIIFEAYEEIEDASINLIIRDFADKERCNLFIQSADDIGFVNISTGEHSFKLMMPYCCLLTGLYSMKINITANGSYYTILDIIESFKFKVKANQSISQSSFYQPRKWEIDHQ
ncbi:ABC transporter ATP-binding protein [Nostoc edaphicum CCNP1411]|uniref:ABC transporter ATP-binding protein n=1 Tax=Nostoc edaphicum CCNP1411 TaxID=1472755 RepID=A0A7D7LH64_9NOSO|nr:ABC transporter ATP-binding protein [Nostoc edaphicum]QMS90671.1 ABC transporter ATP-binding protein [Nostoc edaphicum CCNP1411]